MKTIKCPKCKLVNWSSDVCKRCNSSLTGDDSEIKNTFNRREKTQSAAFSTDRGFPAAFAESGDVKKDAWKKIKWGSIVAIVGFALTFLTIYFGKFPNLAAGETGKKIVALFSLITLLPLAAVLAGFIELATGVPIFKIIEKWEQLPQWLGWLIGIGVFILIIFVIFFVAAIVILNFF